LENTPYIIKLSFKDGWSAILESDDRQGVKQSNAPFSVGGIDNVLKKWVKKLRHRRNIYPVSVKMSTVLVKVYMSS